MRRRRRLLAFPPRTNSGCAPGRTRDLPVPAQGASAHARVFDHAEPSGRSRTRTCCLPRSETRRRPDRNFFRGSMAGLCAPLPTLRPPSHERIRTARGRGGSLRLPRDGLAPSTPCRSPGALRLKLKLLQPNQREALNIEPCRSPEAASNDVPATWVAEPLALSLTHSLTVYASDAPLPNSRATFVTGLLATPYPTGTFPRRIALTSPSAWLHRNRQATACSWGPTPYPRRFRGCPPCDRCRPTYRGRRDRHGKSGSPRARRT